LQISISQLLMKMNNNIASRYTETLVLEYLKKINADISENKEIYDVKIPNTIENLFDSSTIKFTFDPEIARENFCELISPGSNILFKIINHNLKNGPVIFSKPKNFIPDNPNNVVGIRFHFYILLDGLQNDSYIKYVDVDYDSYAIIDQNPELTYSDDVFFELESDKIDFAYIAAIDYLKKIMKDTTDNFVSTVVETKKNELLYINKEYQQRLDEIDQTIRHQQINAKNTSNIDEKWDSATAQIEEIRQEQKNIINSFEKKYQSTIDYALFAAQIFPYNQN